MVSSISFVEGKNVPQPNLTGDPQAAYWLSGISRREAQKVFDEYGAALGSMGMGLSALDLSVAYICEKFGITPKDVTDWAQKKAEMAKAEQEAAGATPATPAQKTSLILADA